MIRLCPPSGSVKVKASEVARVKGQSTDGDEDDTRVNHIRSTCVYEDQRESDPPGG